MAFCLTLLEQVSGLVVYIACSHVEERYRFYYSSIEIYPGSSIYKLNNIGHVA